MADLEKDKQLDDLLDSLLSTYSAVEPRPGLETRILAQVRDAATEKRSWSWSLGWLGAGTVAIVTLLLVVYFLRPTASSHQDPLEAGNPLVQPESLVQPDSRQEVSGSIPAIKFTDRRPTTPRVASEEIYALEVKDRPAVFPTPVALSDQENLFLKYLAGTPRDEVIAQSHSDEVVDGLPDDQSELPATFPARQSITSGTR